MSKRPIEQKQRTRVSRAIRRTGLPARIDLIEWLLGHSYASTKKEAKEIILAGRVRAGSHTLGIGIDQVPGPTAVLDIASGRKPTMVEKQVVHQYIDATHRSDLTVLDA